MVLATLDIVCPSQTEAVYFESDLLEIECHQRLRDELPQCAPYWPLPYPYMSLRRLPGMWYTAFAKQENNEAYFNRRVIFDFDVTKSLSKNHKMIVRVANQFRGTLSELIRFYLVNAPENRILILIYIGGEGRLDAYRATAQRRRIPCDTFLAMLFSEKIEFNTLYTIV